MRPSINRSLEGPSREMYCERWAYVRISDIHPENDYFTWLSWEAKNRGNDHTHETKSSTIIDLTSKMTDYTFSKMTGYSRVIPGNRESCLDSLNIGQVLHYHFTLVIDYIVIVMKLLLIIENDLHKSSRWSLNSLIYYITDVAFTPITDSHSWSLIGRPHSSTRADTLFNLYDSLLHLVFWSFSSDLLIL